jgi:tol-pal system protein YbgF
MIPALRNRLVTAAILAAVLAFMPARANAASKEIIALQTEVQQLLDMVQRLQSTLDTKFAVMQHLAEQTADNSNQVSAAVTALQQKLASQGDSSSAKMDTVSGQVQSLNDSVDELKSRIAKLDKTVEELQKQVQNIQTPPVTQATSSTGEGTASETTPTASSAAQAPPLQATFQAALRDYNAAKYEVAKSEFEDVIHYYPLEDLAGQSEFYLGEIAYRQKEYTDAVKSYNAVIEGFSGSSKAPAAHLRKGLALLQMNKKNDAVRELRLLIQRYPQSPEATQARTKMNAMGVRISAAK